MTASGPTTFVSPPSWQRPHIICIGHFAGARLSCELLNTAIQGQPCSEYVDKFTAAASGDLASLTDLI